MPSTADLVAEVHANIQPFKQGMGEVVKVTETATERIARELEKLNEGFGTIKTAVGSVQGALSTLSRFALGGAALTGVVKIVTNTLEGLSQIGKSADEAGLGTETFQELAYAMGRAGVATKDQADALKAFAGASQDAADGGGDLFETLRVWNPEAAEAISSTESITEQLGILAKAVKEASSEQERAALITAAFGESNAALRRLLMGGAEGIQASIQQARELGVVFDEALIRKAPEIQEQFAAVSAVIGVQFQNSMITAAPTVIEFSGHIADLATAIVPAVDGFNKMVAGIKALFASADLAENSLGTLTAKIRGIDFAMSTVEKRIAAGPTIFEKLTGGGDEALAEARLKLAELMQERMAIEEEIANRGRGEETGRKPAAEPAVRFGPSAVTDEARRALAELDGIHRAMLQATQQTAELAGIEYENQMRKLREALQRGLITEEQFETARGELAAAASAKIADAAEKEAEKRKSLTDKALADVNRIHAEMLKATKATTELATFEYENQLRALQESHDKGLISAQQFEAAKQDLAAVSTAKLAEEAQKQIAPIANALSGTLSRAFDDFLKTGEMNWQSWGAMALEQIAKVAFQMAVIQPLFGGGAGGGGGLFGTALAGVLHEGGIAGQARTRRAVPGLAFATAPRFHNGGIPGLKAGETPAILESGKEAVIPLNKLGGGGRPIIFNINTPDADSFRRSEGQIAAMLTRATQRGQRNM